VRHLWQSALVDSQLGEGDLVLRTWTPDDESVVDDILVSSKADFANWLPSLESDIAEFGTYLERVRPCAEAGSAWYYCVEHNGVVVGQCSIEARDDGVAEIGYWTRSDRTNEGLATRAVLATSRLAADLGFERLVIHCDEGNAGSAAVARKAGFTHVQTVTLDPGRFGTPAQTGREMTWQYSVKARG